MRRTLAPLGLGLGLGLGLSLALGCRSSTRESEPAASPTRPTDEAVSPQTPVPPQTSRGYVGVVTAGEQVDIAPIVAGELVDVYARAGDRVEAGDPIATLDARHAREELRMTEAKLRSEKAALGQALVDREQAAARLAEAEGLVAAGVAARSDVDDARFEHRRAKAAVARSEAAVAEWRTRRGQLQRQLEDTELRAPFSGMIAQRYLDAGAVAGPATPVARLISGDALWVRFAVPPAEVAGLEVGTIVSAELESPAATVEATIKQVAPEVDPAAQLVFVEAELDLPDALRSKLQTGASAWVRPVVPSSRD